MQHTRPLKIIIFSASFFPHPTGATYSAIRLAQTLREMGHRISFIVDDRGSEWRQGGEYDGFPVQSFFLTQSGKFKKLRGLMLFTLHIWKQRNDFDVFHISGGGYVNFLIAFWTKFLTRRKVSFKITLDGWDTPDGAVKDKWGRLVEFCYRRLDGVVAMTSGQADKCRVWGLNGLLHVIPNGVDNSKYHPAVPEDKRALRTELGIPSNAVVAIYVGYLGSVKGIDIIFRVWSQLKDKNSNLMLLLVGDYQKGKGLGMPLAEWLYIHGLEPNLSESPQLKLVGHVEDAEKYLQASDIFIFPSRQEGFGTVQIEAMACGLPCVVNDLPGVSADIFPDETVGFRIGDNKLEDYIRVLSELIADPEKRECIGQAARARTVTCFSRQIVGEKYVEYFKKMTNLLPDNRTKKAQ